MTTSSFLQCFETVGWVIWPVETVPEMTCNVSSGMLSFYSVALLVCVLCVSMHD